MELQWAMAKQLQLPSFLQFSQLQRPNWFEPRSDIYKMIVSRQDLIGNEEFAPVILNDWSESP